MHKYPFLRLVIPFMAGIAAGDGFFYEAMPCKCMAILLIALFFCMIVTHFYLSGYLLRWIYGIFNSLFFFMAGAFLYGYQRDDVRVVWESEKQIYVGRITDVPKNKKNNWVCEVKIESRMDSLQSYPINKNVLLYFPEEIARDKLTCGNRLMVHVHISKPRHKGYTDKFDYARYLTLKKISGIAYVPAEDYQAMGKENGADMRRYAFLIREKLLMLYRQWGFEGEKFAVLSALTLGYKDELTEDIQEVYAATGASHILALSGLHLGLFYVILDFIFRKVFRRRSCKWIRAVLTVSILWVFAFVVGLPSSVVRSAAMFSMFAFSQVTGGRYCPLNILAATALLMLLYNPFSLFDISFLLSFGAVATIFIYQPHLYNIWRVENRFFKYVWTLITVSLAAQLGTAPLVLYYFSRFPVYFLLTNLWVIPLATFILYGSVAMLAFSFIPPVRSGLSMLVVYLLDLLNGGTRQIESWPGTVWDCFSFSGIEAGCFYLALCCFSIYWIIRKRKAKVLIAGMGVVWLGCLIRLCVEYGIYQNDQAFVLFYGFRDNPMVQFVYNRDISFLCAAGNQKNIISVEADRKVKCFCSSNHINYPMVLSEKYEGPGIWKENSLVIFRGKTFCILKDDFWRNKVAKNPLWVDYMYVCKGFKGSLKETTGLFRSKKVILDASLPFYRLEALQQECVRLGLDFVSVAEKGSLSIPL